MEDNRRKRRAEERRVEAIRSDKIAARAATKRRAARPENNKAAQETNRIRLRRKLKVPDDPTQLEQVCEAAQHYLDNFLLRFGQKRESTYLPILIQFILCLAMALLHGGLRKKSSSSSIPDPISNDTSLVQAVWDLIPIDE